jgi:ATP-dependent Clp protease ATP-binding subunit ClpC
LGYSIEITATAKDFIVDKGYDEKFGARPLKRAIQKYVEDPLAEEIVKSNLKEGDSIKIDMKKDATELTVDIVKGTKALPAKDKEK